MLLRACAFVVAGVLGFAAGLGLICAPHSTALADDAWDVDIQYTFGVIANGGGAGATGNDGAMGSLHRSDDPAVEIGYGRKFFAVDFDALHGSYASGQLDVGLAAQVGSLHAFATGSTQTDYNQFASPNASASALASAKVSWQDIMSVVAPLPDGTPLRIDAKLYMTGSIAAAVTGEADSQFHGALANAFATLTGIGAWADQSPTPIQASATDELGHRYTSHTPNPVEVDFSWNTYVGDGAAIGETLEINANGESFINFGSNLEGETTSFFDANYGDTVRWGGITSVYNESTGEYLTDYSVTSASGFDYKHEAPVPEPSVLLTLALLLPAAALRRPRRFYRMCRILTEPIDVDHFTDSERLMEETLAKQPSSSCPAIGPRSADHRLP